MTAQRRPIPVSKATVPRFVWRDVCEGWTLVDTDSLQVAVERMPPDTHELRHVHETVQQFYFVLEGEATVEASGIRTAMTAGHGLQIPPGAPHSMRNDSQGWLEFLVVSSGPPRADRRDLELGDSPSGRIAPHDGSA